MGKKKKGRQKAKEKGSNKQRTDKILFETAKIGLLIKALELIDTIVKKLE